MKNITSIYLRHTLTLPMIAGLHLLPLASWAQSLPTGGVVTAGAAQIGAPAGPSLQVNQTSQRAVINWTGFGIGQGNSVNFVQPNAAASTLNVVTGGDPSVLAGKLTANGSVLLINQNGIAITPTGLVDTRTGFIASTLGMDRDDFMAGRLHFAGKGGAVSNAGQIVSGENGVVALLGSTVRNDGLIRAPLGKVGLASGEAVTLDLNGDGFLQVSLPADAVAADGQPLVANDGSIVADGGSVILRASAVRAAMRDAVNMPGTIQARSVSGQNGAVVLDGGDGTLQLSGKIDVAGLDAGGQGGRIDVGAAQVTLAGAQLDASGAAQGGLVRIGGTYQGGRQVSDNDEDQAFVGRFGALPSLASAGTAAIDAGSLIDVSSATGAGGTAIVWSADKTTMAGAVDARSARGGGAVEIGSSQQVATAGLDRVGLGPGGTLLLDANNFDIGSKDDIYSMSQNDVDGSYSYLLDKDVTAFLSSGANLKLQASQRIWWLDNPASNPVVRSDDKPAGDLTLAVGSNVTLGGSFASGGGNWRIATSGTAANGVANEEGSHYFNLYWAAFDLGTGGLSVLIDGQQGTIALGSVSGASFSAAIKAGTTAGWSPPAIQLSSDITVSGAVTLDGNLRVGNPVDLAAIKIKGQSVTWVGERTGSTIAGEGRIAFIENGVTTRMGAGGLRGGDRVRLGLGDGIMAAQDRTYGDADPTLATSGMAALHVLDYSTSKSIDARDTILVPGSLALTGPGEHAAAGTYSLRLAATDDARFPSYLTYGSYWIDLTPVTAPLTIKPRVLGVQVDGAVTTYGTAAPLVSLSNIANGDQLVPRATVNMQRDMAMTASGGAFGFGARQPAGDYAYTITGIGGDQAGNYVIDPSASLDGSLKVEPKPLSYTMLSTMKAYGTLFPAPLASVWGALPGDDVRPAMTLSKDGVAVTDSIRLPVGHYSLSVDGLAGSAAGNYTLVDTGPVRADLLVSPASLQTRGKIVYTTYGDTPDLLSTFSLVPGDQVDVTWNVSLNGMQFTPSATTPAGWYTTSITGLSGPDAGNYALGPAGANFTWRVAPRPLNFQGVSISQPYGQANLPGPALLGVIGGDDVRGANIWIKPDGSPGSTGGIFNVGTYSVAPAELIGRDAGNYVLGAGSPNMVQVTPKPVSVRLDPLSTVYGTLPQLFPTVEGLVRNDIVTGTVDVRSGPANALTSILPAGSYSLGLQAFLSGPAAANYMLAPDAARFSVPFTVQPKPLFWDASGITTVTYGDAIGATARLSGVLPGDRVGATAGVLDSQGKAIAHPSAGAHLLSASVLNGADAGNYTLFPVGDGNAQGNLIVNPRPITVRAIGNTTSVYGNTPVFADVLYTNVLQGDDPGLVVGDFTQNNGIFSTRTPVGTYAASVVRVANPNYVLRAQAPVTGMVTITPRPIRFSTADASIVYGDLLPAGAATLLDDAVAGDDLHIGNVTPQGAATSGNVAAGQYPLLASLLGRSAGNYLLTKDGSHIGQLTVARRPLDISVDLFANQGTALSSDFTGSQRLYQLEYGYAQALTPRLAIFNLAAGDRVDAAFTSPALQLSSTGNVAAGTYQWTVHDLQDPILSNYEVRAWNSVLKVQQAPLYVTPGALRPDGTVAGAVAEYGSTAGLRAGSAGMEGLKGGAGKQDDVAVGFDFATSAGASPTLNARSPAGTYALQSTGLRGADAANYKLVAAAGDFVIEPKLVTIQGPTLYTTYGVPLRTDLDAPTISGALPGDRLGASYRLTEEAGFNWSLDLQARLDAGAYRLYPTGLTGADAANYRFVDIGSPLKAGVPDLPATNYGQAYIDKRYLAPRTDASALNFIYGGYAPEIAITQPLAGDEVIVNPLAQPITLTGLPVGAPISTLGLLDAGRYTYTAALSGADVRNYTLLLGGRLGPAGAGAAPLPLDLGTIRVLKRDVTTTLADRSTVYGNYAAPAGVVNNLVPGQQVGMVVATMDANGGTVDYNERTNAGGYGATVTALTGDASRNYTLTGSNTARLDITPRELGWVPADAPTAVYGTSVALGGLRGLLFNDDVSVKGSVAGPSGPLALGNGGNGATRFDGKLDVGSYGYSFAGSDNLAGAKSANYVLPAGASGSFSFTPRELVYAIDNATGSYGNFKGCELGCDPWVPGVELGKVHFQTLIDGRRVEGIAAGDDLGGTVGVLDFNGVSGTIDSKTPVGRYFQVLTGLTGKSASNYRLAETGSAPGILTIAPMWLTYSVSNAVYVQGVGLVGNLAAATLRGPDGTPINGDDVSALLEAYSPQRMQAIPNLNVVDEGRYEFYGLGLTGKDAGNYRLIDPGNEGFRFHPTYIGNTGPYGKNIPGTLDVYTGSNLGLGLLGDTPLPVVPKTMIEAPVYYQPVTVPRLNSFGRNIDVTGSAVNTSLTSAGAAVSGTADADTRLGGADLSGNASGATQALAKAGITGITLAASAGGHTDVMVTIGDGYVTYGLQGDAAAEASAGKNGVKLSAEALAQMAAKGGASGSLGAAGDGNLSATTATFVYAKATNEFGLKDGKIVITSKDSVGVGASVGASGGISGSVGSVQLGATVYTPGSFGGSFSATGGYSDGKVSVGLNIGAELGLGGLDINISFSLDISPLTDFGNALLGHHAPSRPFEFLIESRKLAADPVARYAYLNAHPEWRNSPGKTDADYVSAVNFVNDYNALVNGVQKLAADEAATRTHFLNLLKTDPAAAVEYSHASDFARAMQLRQNELTVKANALGVKLIATNGTLTFVNK